MPSFPMKTAKNEEVKVLNIINHLQDRELIKLIPEIIDALQTLSIQRENLPVKHKYDR